jgi:cytochrome P450
MSDDNSIAHLDFSETGFSIRSEQVMAAREQHWYATTNFGIAILRYEDSNALLKDKRLFQGTRRWPSHFGIEQGTLASWWPDIMLSIEGQDHLRLRKLSGPAFSPRVLEPLIPTFAQLAHELIDGFCERGSAEFMSEFAEAYSARVITGLLGMSNELWPKVAELATQLGYVFSVTIKEDLPVIEHGLTGLLELSKELIASRQGTDQDDFVGTLIKANLDGSKVTDHELLMLVSFIIFAGFDTTRNQIGLGMQTFAKHLDQWQKLASNPALAKNAVEEVMRVNPTITWVSREACVAVDYKDLLIPQGKTIHLLTIPSGSDPRRYEDTTFDITATRPPHFGFGGGMHHCLGHYVARLDMAEAYKALAARIPDFKISQTATYLPDSGNTGPIKLPITFTPTARRVK